MSDSIMLKTSNFFLIVVLANAVVWFAIGGCVILFKMAELTQHLLGQGVING